jgi:hypothetical protein
MPAEKKTAVFNRAYAAAVIIITNLSSLRVQRSNPEAHKTLIVMDCFVGCAASQ